MVALPNSECDDPTARQALDRWLASGLAEKLGPSFMVLGRLLTRRIEQALARAGTGLTPAQARSIVMLHFHGPVTQQSLAALTEVDASTLVRTLDVLERDGIAVREQNPADRRAHLVRLTEDGERHVPRLLALWDEVEAEISEGFSDSELATLRDLVSRLVGRMSAGETSCG